MRNIAPQFAFTVSVVYIAYHNFITLPDCFCNTRFFLVFLKKSSKISHLDQKRHISTLPLKPLLLILVIEYLKVPISEAVLERVVTCTPLTHLLDVIWFTNCHLSINHMVHIATSLCFGSDNKSKQDTGCGAKVTLLPCTDM